MHSCFLGLHFRVHAVSAFRDPIEDIVYRNVLPRQFADHMSFEQNYYTIAAAHQFFKFRRDMPIFLPVRSAA